MVQFTPIFGGCCLAEGMLDGEGAGGENAKAIDHRNGRESRWAMLCGARPILARQIALAGPSPLALVLRHAIGASPASVPQPRKGIPIQDIRRDPL